MATPETVSSSCYSVIASMELVKRPPTKTVSTVAERGHGARVVASARARATAAAPTLPPRMQGASAERMRAKLKWRPFTYQLASKEH